MLARCDIAGFRQGGQKMASIFWTKCENRPKLISPLESGGGFTPGTLPTREGETLKIGIMSAGVLKSHNCVVGALRAQSINSVQNIVCGVHYSNFVVE